MECKNLLKNKLRGLHYEGYNYNVKDAKKTRYGCIKKDCKAKLYINVNHDINSVRVVGPHTCNKSTHQSLEKRKMRQILKEKAANNSGTPKLIFDETSSQHKDLAAHIAYPSVKNTIRRAKGQATDPGLQNQCSSIKTFEERLKIYPFLLIYKERKEIPISAECVQSLSKNDLMNIHDENLPKKKEENN